MEILTNTLSSAITAEEPVNVGWFASLGSEAANWMNAAVSSGANLLDKMAKGGKELIASIKNGTFASIFRQWAKDDPVAAAAGTIAGGLAASVMLIVGGSVVGAVVGWCGGSIREIGGVGDGWDFRRFGGCDRKGDEWG